MTPDAARALEELVDQALARDQGSWPRDADAAKRALLVVTTDALFAYYLAADGTVYELDLDRAIGSLERVNDAARIREVYATAARQHPALASLVVLDPTRSPQTLDEALAYGGDVVVAWDDRSRDALAALHVYAVSLAGARHLYTHAVASSERAALLERLVMREIRVGFAEGDVVWIGDTELHVWTRTTCALHAWFSNIRSGDVVLAASELSCVVASDRELRLGQTDGTHVGVGIPSDDVPVRLADDVATWLGIPCYRNGRQDNARTLEMRRGTQALVDILVRLPREGLFPSHTVSLGTQDDVALELRLTAAPDGGRGRTLELRASRVDQGRHTSRVIAHGSVQALASQLRMPRTASELQGTATALRADLV